MSDRELQLILSRIRAGDKSALHEVYVDMKVPVFVIINRIVTNRMDAEDVLQEFFVKYYKNPPAENIRKPRAYMFQMARNMALDSLRKNKGDLQELDEDDGYDPWHNENNRLDVKSAMKILDDNTREIITLHINGGLKFREIAEITKSPIGTVLWKYRKGLDSLKKYFNGD